MLDTLVRTMKEAAAIVPYLSAVLSLLKTRAAPDWDGTKGHVGALTSEATIATFLAAIQAQLVAISYQDNSTRLKVATNTLGFAGLLMGVISACLALLASNILQRHIAIVDKQLTAIETATAEQLDDLTLALTSGGLLSALDMFNIQRRTTEKMVARFTELQRTLPNAARAQGNNAELDPQTETAISGLQGPDIRAMVESLTHIRGALSIGESAGGAILYSVLCFFASVICLVVSTQPHTVWIVSAVVCSFVLIHLGVLGIRLPSVFDI